MPNRSFSVLMFVLTAFVVYAFFANASKHPAAVRIQNQGTPPRLVFACDRPTNDLPKLFTPDLIADIKELKAGVALSIEDFTPARAQVVRQLNAAGIPMTAWIVVPNAGYYVNADNESQTATRFAEFDQWTRENNLRWDAVGLDIEPNFGEFGMLSGHKLRLISLMLRRAYDSRRIQRARGAYTALIRQMQSRGYYVQTYQLIPIADERKAHSTLLERVLGLVDVRGNEEVLMLYSSFNHAADAGIIWEYGPDSQAIAVGSTAASGNPAADSKYPPLNWDEFSRDLIVARHFSSTVGVYSLEGCVRQGFISRLKAMDWKQPVVLSGDSIARVVRLRKRIHAVLWVGSHIVYFFVAFVLVMVGLVRVVVRWRRKRRLIANTKTNAG